MAWPYKLFLSPRQDLCKLGIQHATTACTHWLLFAHYTLLWLLDLLVVCPDFTFTDTNSDPMLP